MIKIGLNEIWDTFDLNTVWFLYDIIAFGKVAKLKQLRNNILAINLKFN